MIYCLPLTRMQTEALAYGPKFCIQPKHVSPTESQPQFEMFFDQNFASNQNMSTLSHRSNLKCFLTNCRIRNLPLSSLGLLKAKLVLLEHKYCTAQSKQKHPLSQEHNATLKVLKANDQLIILKPDKLPPGIGLG